MTSDGKYAGKAIHCHQHNKFKFCHLSRPLAQKYKMKYSSKNKFLNNIIMEHHLISITVVSAVVCVKMGLFLQQEKRPYFDVV